MDGSLDVVGHTVSAGGGAALTLIVNQVISFFRTKQEKADEIRLAERLQSIEGKLDQALDEIKKHDDHAERLAWLEAKAGRSRGGGRK